MNRSKIEWCDHTWNPITGCLHGCEYCYARRMAQRFCGDVRLNKMATGDYEKVLSPDGKRELYVLKQPMLNETGNTLVYPFGFEPTLHRYRFDILDKLKMGNNIFVGAMADVFGDWVPDSWLDSIFTICDQHPEHNYLFLTKNAKRYREYNVPGLQDNYWYGTTVTKISDVGRIYCLPIGCKRFVSIEPILEDVAPETNYIMLKRIDWMIIGAETGRRAGKVVPQFAWIKKLVVAADYAGVPVFMKESLVPIVGERNMRRDFPKELQRKTISPKMQRKLYDVCGGCGKQLRKSEMITMLAKSARGEQPKQYAFLCKECFESSCNRMGVEIPKLKMMEDKNNGKDNGK